MFVFKRLYYFYLVFVNEHSRITGLQGKGEGISLTPHYYFHPLHRHLDISRAITAESSPLHITCSWTQTGNLWFPSASHPSRHGRKHSKYKKWLSMMILICIKQYLSKIWSLIHEKLSNSEAELKKRCL